MSEEVQNTEATTDDAPEVNVETPKVEVKTPKEKEVRVETKIPEGYLSQAEVNKINAATRREAAQKTKEETERQISESLGVSIEEAKELIAQQREAEEARQSELEKAQKKLSKIEEDRNTTKSELEAARTKIAEISQNYALRDALRDSGLRPARLKAALRLADTSLLEVDDDGNVTGVEEVVQAIMEESPEWFGPEAKPKPVSTPEDEGEVGSRPKNFWGMTDEQFQAYQEAVLRGESVTLPG